MAEILTSSIFDLAQLGKQVDGNSISPAGEAFWGLTATPRLTTQWLKRYFCYRLTEQHLENQIYQGSHCRAVETFKNPY